jgi:hypothetical protein
LLFAIVGVFEEIVQAWTWLDTAMGADGITALAKERDRRTVRRYGETYEPNPSWQ